MWSKKKAPSRSRNSWKSDSGDDSGSSDGSGGLDARHISRPVRSRSHTTESTALADAPVTGGTITSVSLQQHSGAERVNVFLDGAYAFSLAAIIGAHLREGELLDIASVRELMDRDAVERAYERALAFLAARPRSKTEVRRRLVRAGSPPAAIASAIERLDDRGLVNDDEFAAYWVAQRLTFHPRGPRALRAELRTKGVDAETVAAAIEPLSEDQVPAACRAAQRRAMQIPSIDEREFTRAISEFLVRRGFDYGAVRTAARQLWQERNAESEGSA